MARSPKGLELVPKLDRDAARVLTAEAQSFIASLQRSSAVGRQEVVEERAAQVEQFAAGKVPAFRSETSAIRAGSWKINALPRELADLRTVIAVPPARKELLGGLNSGARLCLADYHDALPPVWDLLVDGQLNLLDRWTSAMEHVDKATGRRVSLSQKLAALMVRVRPLTADEPRLKVDGKPVAAGLLDAGLYLYHNARTAIAKASGPYLCLTDIRCSAEARLWNDILIHAQSLLGLPFGTIRAHVMLDSAAAAFELDEIGYELREHLAGITVGGERYAQSLMCLTANLKGRSIPSAAPDALLAYVVQAAHKRGCPVIASQGDDAASAVREGADGIMVSKPEDVAAAARIFNDGMPTANQTYVSRDDVQVKPMMLTTGKETQIGEELFQSHADRSLRFLEAWLSGTVEHMPADAAMFEAMRMQLWQAVKLGIKFESGAKAGEALLEDVLFTTMKQAKDGRGEDAYRAGRFREASALLRSLVLSKEWVADFAPLVLKKLG